MPRGRGRPAGSIRSGFWRVRAPSDLQLAVRVLAAAQGSRSALAEALTVHRATVTRLIDEPRRELSRNVAGELLQQARRFQRRAEGPREHAWEQALRDWPENQAQPLNPIRHVKQFLNSPEHRQLEDVGRAIAGELLRTTDPARSATLAEFRRQVVGGSIGPADAKVMLERAGVSVPAGPLWAAPSIAWEVQGLRLLLLSSIDFHAGVS